MKRYWKIGTLTLFIAVVLTGLFIQSSSAFSSHPEFVIEYRSGDEELGERLRIEGEYNETPRHSSLATITNEGTTYSELSYFSLLNGAFLHPEIKQLQENYKNFMRGKRESMQYFDETSEMLGYVMIDTDSGFRGFELTDLYFDIDLLEKETGERKTFQIDLPKEKGLHYSDVMGVHFTDNELKVVVNQSLINDETGMEQEEIHLFSIDVNEQEILNDEVIAKEGISGTNDLYVVLDLVPMENEESTEYFVFMKNTRKDVYHENGHYESENVNSEFISYHIESGEYETTDFSDMAEQASDLYPLHVDGKHLVLYEIDNKELIVYLYNLEEKELRNQQHYDLPEEAEEVPFFTIKEDKVIMADGQVKDNVKPLIHVYDLETAKLLYEGVITLKGDAPAGYEFWMQEITLQK